MTIGLDTRQWAKRGPCISAPGIQRPGYLYSLKDVAVPLATLPDFSYFAAFTPLSNGSAKQLPTRDEDFDMRLYNKANWISSMLRSRGLRSSYVSTTFRKVHLRWGEKLLQTRHFSIPDSGGPQMVSDMSSLQEEHRNILKILESTPVRSLQDLAHSRGQEFQVRGPRDFETIL
ncbi:uncharacterized protein EI97DRAFT_454044 [Westerdykella ornata]|uniref:Uncharacterized protein n=1 Tax=Westerdykella ornata TaxID=318751 RepID=A0A6A6JW08_WESOR|nr:uncharacterized protein EI97DRAFT_454044 [Westerdykella ornata]KAF2280800.1 hypothetical protein EI97DRAFT_454044 [Westerdykella ornata]